MGRRRIVERRAPRARSVRTVCLGLVLAAALALGAPSKTASAVDYRKVGDVAFDIVILRPLNLTAVIVGPVFFGVSAPFVWPSNGIPIAWDQYVYYPFEYTFLRELGENF